nr:uncharacterized protein LOC126527637 [Dermacentor andersoni]
MSSPGSGKQEHSDGFRPHSDEEPLVVPFLHPQEGSSGSKSVSSVALPKAAFECSEASPSSFSAAGSPCSHPTTPSIPSPQLIVLPDHWITERADLADQGTYCLVPKTSAESVNAQISNGERAPSLLLVPKSSDEVLAALSDDQQPPQVPHFSDDRHFSSVSLGYRSNDQADIVSGQPQDKRSQRFFEDMAKKPSTSSLDRSDIVDFVVDNRTTEETRAIYNSWASNYEEDMTLQKYKAPSIMAHFMNQELQVKKDAVILDVGSGTGLLGVQLKNLGYSYMDALDYSEEMMSEAKKKRLYKRHFLEKVSKNNKLSLRDAEYDVVVLCGCLMPGHIMPDALAEVARLLKPNGRLMWIHRTLDHYESKSEQFLETRFTGTLQALCRQFRMEIAVRKKVQEYRLKCDGQIFALKKK